jgi:signal transduction histidine kinase
VIGLVAGVVTLLAVRLRVRFWGIVSAFMPLPLGAVLLGGMGLELPAATTAAAALAVAAGWEIREAARGRREIAVASRRVKELTALAATLEEGKREDVEARRVVAHELRTPLTSVRGLAQLLSDFDLSEDERKRVAGMVVSETSRLSGMVEALLDLERLKLRDFAEQARHVDISRLIKERSAVLAKGRVGGMNVEVVSGVSVMGDAELLGRVVDNLVGNAVKFSPEGASVGLSLVASHEGVAVLEVSDRGPGIAPQDREKIFRRFGRGGASGSVPGLGLGLALVAEAAAWHRGSVEAEPNPGGGSIFRFRIPLAPRTPSKERM